jgi:hypothetical protein
MAALPLASRRWARPEGETDALDVLPRGASLWPVSAPRPSAQRSHELRPGEASAAAEGRCAPRIWPSDPCRELDCPVINSPYSPMLRPSDFFNFDFPSNVFHLRPRLFPPPPGPLPEAEIHARLVEALGVVTEATTRRCARLRAVAGRRTPRRSWGRDERSEARLARARPALPHDGPAGGAARRRGPLRALDAITGVARPRRLRRYAARDGRRSVLGDPRRLLRDRLRGRRVERRRAAHRDSRSQDPPRSARSGNHRSRGMDYRSRGTPITRRRPPHVCRREPLRGPRGEANGPSRFARRHPVPRRCRGGA